MVANEKANSKQEVIRGDCMAVINLHHRQLFSGCSSMPNLEELISPRKWIVCSLMMQPTTAVMREKREGYQLQHHERKEHKVPTYQAIKAQLLKDLAELQQLPTQGRLALAERTFKEELIGQQCYEAERSLDLPDLLLLQKTLGLDEQAWRTYKAKLTHSL
jgi:hypothetical protein